MNGNHYIINLPNVQGKLKSCFKCVEIFKVIKAFKNLNDKRQNITPKKMTSPSVQWEFGQSNHFKLNIHLSKQQFSSYLTFWKILLTYIVANAEKTNKCKWLVDSCYLFIVLKLNQNFKTFIYWRKKFIVLNFLKDLVNL